ncbi:hypothetical protein ACFW04_013075 [Cataglyphis niger]
MAKSASQTTLLHRLNGHNFKLWKFQMEATLRSQDLFGWAHGIEAEPTDTSKIPAWMKSDGKTMGILISSLEADQAQLILTCKSAKEVWDKLLAIFEKKNEVSVMTLYKEYFSLKMSETESVAAYVSKVTKLVAEIEEQGEKLSDNIKMSRIISSLIPRFRNFKTVFTISEKIET